MDTQISSNINFFIKYFIDNILLKLTEFKLVYFLVKNI